MAVSDVLLEEYLGGIAMVTFTKKTTGEVRVMPCTKNLALIPEELHPSGTDTRNLNPDIIRVFSLDRNEWRSFYKSSIINIEKQPDTNEQVNNNEANNNGQSN
jgi:hypothetical protein